MNEQINKIFNYLAYDLFIFSEYEYIFKQRELKEKEIEYYTNWNKIGALLIASNSILIIPFLLDCFGRINGINTYLLPIITYLHLYSNVIQVIKGLIAIRVDYRELQSYLLGKDFVINRELSACIYYKKIPLRMYNNKMYDKPIPMFLLLWTELILLASFSWYALLINNIIMYISIFIIHFSIQRIFKNKFKYNKLSYEDEIEVYNNIISNAGTYIEELVNYCITCEKDDCSTYKHLKEIQKTIKSDIKGAE